MKRFLRFFGVGAVLLGSSTGSYVVLTRWIAPSLPASAIYATITALFIFLNFLLNARFTFKAEVTSAALFRFLCVAIPATLMTNALFWVFHVLLGLYDVVTAVLNAISVAAFTFTSHRLFTFHPDPWRWLPEAVRRPIPALRPAALPIEAEEDAEPWG